MFAIYPPTDLQKNNNWLSWGLPAQKQKASVPKKSCKILFAGQGYCPDIKQSPKGYPNNIHAIFRLNNQQFIFKMDQVLKAKHSPSDLHIWNKAVYNHAYQFGVSFLVFLKLHLSQVTSKTNEAWSPCLDLFVSGLWLPQVVQQQTLQLQLISKGKRADSVWFARAFFGHTTTAKPKQLKTENVYLTCTKLALIRMFPCRNDTKSVSRLNAICSICLCSVLSVPSWA